MGKVLRRDKQEDRHSDEDRYIYQGNARREENSEKKMDVHLYML